MDSPVKLSDRVMDGVVIMAFRNGRERAPMNDETYRYIWERLNAGDLGMDIAADLGVHPGRVSELNTGKRGNHITGLPAT